MARINYLSTMSMGFYRARVKYPHRPKSNSLRIRACLLVLALPTQT